MALYKHVTSKDDLYAGVSELVWEEIATAAPPDDDWSAWLRTYGTGIRDVTHRHPAHYRCGSRNPLPRSRPLELFDANSNTSSRARYPR